MFRCVRNNPLWYHDLNFYCDVVRVAAPSMDGADKLWSTTGIFGKRTRDVLEIGTTRKPLISMVHADYLKPENA